MANAMYLKNKAKAYQGVINLLTSDVRLVLVDLADYTFSQTHEFLSDVPAGARVAVSSSLTGKTFDAATAGFKSDFKTFGTVSGDISEALIGYIHTGDPTTSRLIWFADTGVTGLPISPDGRDIKVTPASGGWFAG